MRPVLSRPCAVLHGVPSPSAAPQVTQPVAHGVAWLQARRSFAFTRGEEAALQRAISADAYLFLYKELVRLCKDRAVCWAGLEWLAKRLGTSVGTVKRWMDELVRAELVRRKARAGGLTTLTIVPALDDFDTDPATSTLDHAAQRGRTEPASLDVGAAASKPTLFFGPTQQITNDPPESAAVICHTVKRQKIKPFVVGCAHERENEEPLTPVTDDVTAALQAAGLTDPLIINEFQNEPLSEIQAIIGYVARQRHITNPPGLIVALARNKAGEALARSPRSSAPPRESAVASRGIQSGTAALAAPLELEERLRVQLQASVDPDTWAVWLADLHVLDIKETHMVIGAPNCLARDYVVQHHLRTMIDAASAVLGRLMQVELVVDTAG